MEKLGRKARNLTGRPHDSSAARNYFLCGFFALSEEGVLLCWEQKKRKGERG